MVLLVDPVAKRSGRCAHAPLLVCGAALRAAATRGDAFAPARSMVPTRTRIVSGWFGQERSRMVATTRRLAVPDLFVMARSSLGA